MAKKSPELINCVSSNLPDSFILRVQCVKIFSPCAFASFSICASALLIQQLDSNFDNAYVAANFTQ